MVGHSPSADKEDSTLGTDGLSHVQIHRRVSTGKHGDQRAEVCRARSPEADTGSETNRTWENGGGEQSEELFSYLKHPWEHKLAGQERCFQKACRERFATWEDSLKHSGLPVGWWPWEEPDLPVVTEQGCGRSGGHPRPPTSSPGLCALPQVLVPGSRREARGPACAFLHRPQALSPVVLRAALVPIFSFGENDAFDQVENLPGSWLRWCQDRLQRIMGISLPLFHGQGVFQHSFGFLPYRRPITTVGEPRPRLGVGRATGPGARAVSTRGLEHGPDPSLTSWSAHSKLGHGHTGR